MLDIFCGAGGLSFLEHRRGGAAAAAVLRARGSDARVGVRPRWAVDLNASAIATYEANHGGGVDVSFFETASRRRRRRRPLLFFVLGGCSLSATVCRCSRSRQSERSPAKPVPLSCDLIPITMQREQS